jgi:hypothetical protein
MWLTNSKISPGECHYQPHWGALSSGMLISEGPAVKSTVGAMGQRNKGQEERTESGPATRSNRRRAIANAVRLSTAQSCGLPLIRSD